MLKQFKSFIYERRDFYYPRFIGCLCLSLFGILFARVTDHQMLDWILIMFGLIIPLTSILAPFIQWLLEFKTDKKVKTKDELDEIMPWGQNYLNETRGIHVKRFLLQIKMKVNNRDLIGYLRNRGITLIEIDPWIEDTIVVETTRTAEQLNDMQYISSVRELN